MSITTNFTTPFAIDPNGKSKGDVVLNLTGTVTMKIDLGAEPSTEQLNGETVYIPQFTMVDGDVHFEAV